MLAHADVSAIDEADSSVVCSDERRVEAEVLMQAVTALRDADVLTDAEFEAKRQRLAARL